jgi:hypothetical protein
LGLDGLDFDVGEVVLRVPAVGAGFFVVDVVLVDEQEGGLLDVFVVGAGGERGCEGEKDVAWRWRAGEGIVGACTTLLSAAGAEAVPSAGG